VSYAVTACSGCAQPWAVDLRQASSSCPHCGARAELRSRRLLWQGDSPQAAQAAAASLRIPAGAGPLLTRLAERPAHSLPRHDSPLDAAAARGAGLTNKSERAEAVAEALTRLCGMVPHEDLLEALDRAAIPRARAEQEVVRMLAVDRMMEPRPGHYRYIGGPRE